MPDTAGRPLTFKSLPYDIRFLIYQHIFPSPPQIYLWAYKDKPLSAKIAHGTFATNLLLTCHAINSEAAGYLYNTYLFNLIGTKEDCLRSYKPFLKTLRKYAREEVRVNAFSNGIHSDTMCISMHTGDGKMAILRSRRRGVETTLEEIRQEVRVEKGRPFARIRRQSAGVVMFSASLLVVVVGWSVQKFVQSR